MATTTRRSKQNGTHSTSRSRTSPEPRLGQDGPELQRFGTLRQLPIALSAQTRRTSCRLLNEILSD